MKLKDFTFIRYSGLNQPLHFGFRWEMRCDIPMNADPPNYGVDILREPKEGIFKLDPTPEEYKIIERAQDRDEAIKMLVLFWKVQGLQCSLRERK